MASGLAGLATGPGSPQQLEALLAAFTNPDNGVRRRAEAAWEDMKQRLPDEVRRLSPSGDEGDEAPRALHAHLVLG